MTRYTLAINNCFAVKRWPEPEGWASIVRDRLRLDTVQHSLDLVALDGPRRLREEQAKSVRSACLRFGLTMHSTFTGLAAYSSNLLLDPDPAVRRYAEAWYGRALEFTAQAGGRATGGHVGAFSVTDWEDSRRQGALTASLRRTLRRLSARAKQIGLEELYIENLAAAREPSTVAGVEQLLTGGDDEHVPVVLCLDVGHQCVPGTSGPERDPYAWLEALGGRAPVVQLQQSDAEADHHWPFTHEMNARGRIEAGRVLDSLDASGATDVLLVLEVIPPFEQDDEQVLRDLEESVGYWRVALEQHAHRGGAPSAAPLREARTSGAAPRPAL